MNTFKIGSKVDYTDKNNQFALIRKQLNKTEPMIVIDVLHQFDVIPQHVIVSGNEFNDTFNGLPLNHCIPVSELTIVN